MLLCAIVSTPFIDLILKAHHNFVVCVFHRMLLISYGVWCQKEIVGFIPVSIMVLFMGNAKMSKMGRAVSPMNEKDMREPGSSGFGIWIW